MIDDMAQILLDELGEASATTHIDFLMWMEEEGYTYGEMIPKLRARALAATYGPARDTLDHLANELERISK